MAKNRKTVRKGFTYLQCDDFADYLSSMAAQGWHFKEWGAGLVFEKGEPEQAVYAVEVFFKGSQYDLRPEIHTLDFADYCKAAGWQLIDSKQKYCIFKRITPDAVPIVTPEERLENATKAYRGQLIWQVVLSVVWLGNVLMRIFLPSQLIDTLFSVNSLMAVYWFIYFLFTIGKCVWYALWVRKAKKRCANRETKLLSHANESYTAWFATLVIAGLSVGFAALGEGWLLLLCAMIVIPILIAGILLAKFRPDKSTNIIVQIAVAVAVVMLTNLFAICVVISVANNDPSPDSFPLVYEDLDDTALPGVSTMHTSSAGLLGTTHYYSVQHKNAGISYEIYETKHDWILDIVWEHKLSKVSDVSTSDCTALWAAESAYHYDFEDYYVRYDNAILILRIRGNLVLTEEHVAIIRDALELEG